MQETLVPKCSTERKQLVHPENSFLSKGMRIILTLSQSGAWTQPRKKAELFLTTLTSFSFLEKQEPPAAS